MPDVDQESENVAVKADETIAFETGTIPPPEETIAPPTETAAPPAEPPVAPPVEIAPPPSEAPKKVVGVKKAVTIEVDRQAFAKMSKALIMGHTNYYTGMGGKRILAQMCGVTTGFNDEMALMDKLRDEAQ